MSRLGDMIRQERLRQGFSPKQLAKKSGVSEKFIQEVESGKRIIADKEATRILKVMGQKSDVLADFEAVSDGIAAPAAPARQPQAKPAPQEPAPSGAPNESWLNALKGVLRAVPVNNIHLSAIGQRTLPTENGKIAGAAAEKVFYLEAPDDSMMGYRIRRGDLALIVPAPTLKSDAFYLLEYGGKRGLRKITVQDNNRLLLQWYDYEPKAEVFKLEDVKFIGQVKRVEFEL